VYEAGAALIRALPRCGGALKDKEATYSYSKKNFYLRIIKKMKQEFPESCLISDVAMDPYSSDGHDGLGGGRPHPER
jgi:porphobilinogen synthase